MWAVTESVSDFSDAVQAFAASARDVTGAMWVVVCYTGTMWDITSSAWTIESSMWAFTASICDVTTSTWVYTETMWAITSSMWAVTAPIKAITALFQALTCAVWKFESSAWDVAASVCTARTQCMLLYPLRVTLRLLSELLCIPCLLLQPLFEFVSGTS